MIDKDLLKSLSDTLKSKGIKDIRYYISEAEKTSLSLYKGESDGSSVSSVQRVFAEGNYNGNLGSVYIENLNKDLFNEYAEIIKATAEYNKKPFIAYDIDESLTSKEALVFPENSEILSHMAALEEKLYASDKRISNINHFSTVKAHEKITLMDENGKSCHNSSGYIFQNIDIISEENNIKKSSGSYRSSKAYDKGLMEIISKEALKESTALLNSVIPESGNYAVIFKNTVFAEILSMIFPIFYADVILNDMSPLKNKIGEKVFSDILNIYEDPVSKFGRVYRTFDDEGVKTQRKNIITNGAFETILHNQSTASKMNTVSTGNAFKKSIQESPSIGVSNIFITKGDLSYEELKASMGSGIVITNVQGLHAGINTLTGDISLLSTGILIENGKEVSGVEQITVAGNLFDMLKNISAIGNDWGSTSFSSMANLSFITCPSILFQSLTVAGK